MPTQGQRNAQIMRELKAKALKKEANKSPVYKKKKPKKPKHPVKQNNAIKVFPYKKGMGIEFYSTREWMKIRWECLIKSDGKCIMCGRSKQDNAILHVDHIKPRSKYPELELDINNLQILCKECNLGKGSS